MPVSCRGSQVVRKKSKRRELYRKNMSIRIEKMAKDERKNSVNAPI